MAEEIEFNPGEHNTNLEHHRVRLLRQGAYKDRSCIQVTPTRGDVPIEVVKGWLEMKPMNAQRFARLLMRANSTAAAYNELVEDAIRQVPAFQLILFLEDDVICPPETIVQLTAGIEAGFDAVGALCWERKHNGIPMVLGNPNDTGINYYPQVPVTGGLQPCRAVHLGCTMVRAAIFRDLRWQPTRTPWFAEGRTFEDAKEVSNMTPDVWFFHHAGQLGYTVACDTGLHVGHFDRATGRVF